MESPAGIRSMNDHDVENLYQRIILEHARSPHNFRVPDTYSAHAEGDNPMCGDQISIYVSYEGQGELRRLGDVCFQGRGCAISIASASLMTELMSGCDFHAADALIRQVQEALRSGGDATQASPLFSADLKALEPLASVRAFPSRAKCALLPWSTLQALLAGKGSASTE